MNREKAIESFGKLLDIMDRLRSECPWDKEQTMESLRPLTIEETYELSDAILSKDNMNISKELGDILLHIVFYAKIGSEGGSFDVENVIEGLCEKLIYRHPHVFSETEVSGTRDVIQNWESLKSKEKNGNKSLLSGVPASLPALIKAYRIQDKARAVGFDWQERSQVWDKVREEIGEFEKEAEMANITGAEGGNGGRVEEEFGDLMFSLVNAARLYNINPDTALEMTNNKFIKRFNYLEKVSKERGLTLKNISLEQMDEIWEEAKKFDKNG
jgi:XTP/dITP diphosphohydrolase